MVAIGQWQVRQAGHTIVSLLELGLDCEVRHVDWVLGGWL